MKTVPGIHMSNPFESEYAHVTSPMRFPFGKKGKEKEMKMRGKWGGKRFITNKNDVKSSVSKRKFYTTDPRIVESRRPILSVATPRRFEYVPIHRIGILS